ncbi:MAG TPA: hypothetical protein VD948_08735 [Rhodothermales bacterium]|nr:hypothetical protein [Rhodothermales bacterium]
MSGQTDSTGRSTAPADEEPARCPKCGGELEYDPRNGLFWHASLHRERVAEGARGTGVKRECWVTTWKSRPGGRA